MWAEGALPQGGAREATLGIFSYVTPLQGPMPSSVRYLASRKYRIAAS